MPNRAGGTQKGTQYAPEYHPDRSGYMPAPQDSPDVHWAVATAC